MHLTRQLGWSAVLVILTTGGFAYWAHLHRDPFEAMDYVALFGVLVALAAVVNLLVDYGMQLDMRLPKHLQTLGRGYGLVHALRSMIRRIDEVRAAIEAGTMTAQDAADAEQDLFKVFSHFFSDRRWKRVHRLKKLAQIEEAQALALQIRKDHGLE